MPAHSFLPPAPWPLQVFKPQQMCGSPRWNSPSISPANATLPASDPTTTPPKAAKASFPMSRRLSFESSIPISSPVGRLGACELCQNLRRLGKLRIASRRDLDRDLQPSLRPVARRDLAAVLLGDAARDRQAQAGARVVGREVGVEDPRQEAGRHARTLVLDRDARPRP